MLSACFPLSGTVTGVHSILFITACSHNGSVIRDIAGFATKEAAMTTEVFPSTPEPEKQLASSSLLDALLARRSRRFGKGMRLNGGPLAYESAREPEPLSSVE